MLRWARPNRALFSTFFHFFVGTYPELALFDPLFVPVILALLHASAGGFWPFPAALLHVSVGPGLPKWQWKTGASDLRLPIFDLRLSGENGTAFNAEDAEDAEGSGGKKVQNAECGVNDGRSAGRVPFTWNLER